jgi:hypothetical protein
VSGTADVRVLRAGDGLGYAFKKRAFKYLVAMAADDKGRDT